MNKEKLINISKTIGSFLGIYFCVLIISSIMIIGVKNTFSLNFFNSGIVTDSTYFIISLAFTTIFLLILKKCNDERKIDKVFFLILLLSLIIIFYNFIIGKAYYIYYDIGSDTKEQYFPYFLNELLNLKDKTFSTWNFQYGLGESLFGINHWTFDIFSIILVLISFIVGAGKLQYLLIWMQILKVIVVFFLSKKYLSYFLKDRLSICLSSYLCAMNGFLFLWGQHYFLGTSCVYILLMLCAIENYLLKENKKSILFLILSTASLLMFSYYIGYMVLLVSGIYFIFRYFYIHKEKKLKQITISFGKCLYGVFIGLLLSCVIFIPSVYHVLTSSSRLSNVNIDLFAKIMSSFLGSFNFKYIMIKLSRLISNNILCLSSSTSCPANYYELPQLFCTIFIFFFLIQWIIYEFKKAKTKKEYIFAILKVLALYLLIFNGLSGLIFNSFAYEFYRYTFVVMPFLTLIIGIVLEKVIKENRINVIGFVLSFILSLVTLYFSYNGITKEVVRIIAVLLILGFILLIFIKYKKNNKYLYMFIFITISSTIFDNYIVTNYRTYGNSENFPLIWEGSKLVDDTGKAIAWIKENDLSFYRTEILGYENISYYGDPFIYQISSATWYNSTGNKDLFKFYKEIYPNADLLIYNKTVTRLYDQSDLQALYLLNSKYILSLDDVNFEGIEKINQFGNVYVYKNTKTNSVAKWYNKVISEEEFLKLKKEKRNKKLYEYAISEEKFDLDEKSYATVSEFELKKQTEIEGVIEASGDGLLMISIPAQEGWEAYVDDELTETYNVDYAFIGIKIAEGKHTVKLKYKAPKLNIGIMCSCLGAIGLIILILPSKIKRNKIIK